MTNFLKKVFQSITVQSIQGYEVDKDPLMLLGQWKIYNGKSKLKLGSVWICDAKQNTQAKKEYQNIIKLKYPAILNVLEPLVDEKTYIAFVTERIECNLSQALSDGKYQFSEIEIKLHLLELIDGLQFLHNNVRQVHLDISPDRIYITENGRWKIGGSGFSQQVLQPIVEIGGINFYDKQNSPTLSYSSPEVLNGQCGFTSDVFSLGLVVLRLLKYINPKVSVPEFTQVEQYRQFAQQISQEVLKYGSYFSDNFIRFLSQMLSVSTNRPSLVQFQQNEWFKDPYLITFNILNKLPELDMQQQITFFKGLSQIIFSFEKIILKKRLLPIVLSLTCYDHLVTGIIQIILEMMRRDDILNQQQFQADIWPKIKTIITGKEIPAQVLYDMVLAIPIFHKYIQPKELQEHLIPLLIKCYECKIFKLQDMAIRVTEFIVEHTEFTFSKTKILPRIYTLCLDPNIEVRKISLVCIYKLLNVIDSDIVLQTLEKVKSLGTDRAINQIVLKIYQMLSKTLSSDLIANKLLPQITPYLTDNSLSKQEFQEYYETLLSLLAKIKDDKEKVLKDGDTTVILVDYKLALPDPKRIADATNNKFDFLTQFDLGVQQQAIKPEIKEELPPGIPTGVPIQIGQQPTVGIPVHDPFGFANLQTAQPIQPQRISSQQPQQVTQVQQPAQQVYQQNQFNQQQQQPVQQPFQQPFQQTIQQTNKQTQSQTQFQPPPIQQQQSQQQQGGFQQQQQQPAFQQQNLFQQQTQFPQQQVGFDSLFPSQQVQSQIPDWGAGFQDQKTEQKPFQDIKKLSSRPLFNAKPETKVIDPFANDQQKVNDPWQQQTTNNVWQTKINDPWQQPQQNQLNNPEQNQKNKYSSFDDLI